MDALYIHKYRPMELNCKISGKNQESNTAVRSVLVQTILLYNPNYDILQRILNKYLYNSSKRTTFERYQYTILRCCLDIW